MEHERARRILTVIISMMHDEGQFESGDSLPESLHGLLQLVDRYEAVFVRIEQRERLSVLCKGSLFISFIQKNADNLEK